MVDIDTSSYPRASLPTQRSALEMAGQLGALQQQKQSIDQQKLDQANQALGYMVRAMGSLGPNASKDDYAKAAQNAVDQGLVPQQQENVFLQHLQAAPDSQSFYKQFMSSAMDTQKQIEFHVGRNKDITDQSNIYSGIEKPAIQGGGFAPATSLPIQVPPTTETIDNRRLLSNGQPNPNYLSKGLVGPSGPPGVVQVPHARSSLPIAPIQSARPVSGPIGPSIQTGFDFNQRFAGEPNKFTTAPAPGTAEAVQAVGSQSGKDYATDLQRAKNFQADLYPAETALQGIKELGTQGVGPGTEALNNIKSALITWLPNADKEAIDKVGTFEQTRKYLTQIARGAGNTGTNDQLAAAFEANPSIKMSQAATENVLKSVIALRKMQHAQTLLFGQQNLPESQYSQWIAKNQNILDPRAFGFDMMDNDAKNKLLSTMATKDNYGNWISKKGREKDFQKFEQSLSFANDAGLIEPPGRR